MEGFSPLELLLITAVGSLVGGIVVLARWFFSYLKQTNKERGEEIKSSVLVQTELKGVIAHNNYLVEQLPDRIQDKVRAALIDEKIQTAIRAKE